MDTITTVTVPFMKGKETKGTFKFEEVPELGEPTVCGSLYVQKFALARLGNPEILTVTIVAG